MTDEEHMDCYQYGTIPAVADPTTPDAAIEQLRDHQQQLDEHGVMVGVSRQAVDEVLAYFAALARPSPEPSDAVRCSHEAYQGACAHCGVPIVNGRALQQGQG